MEKKFDDLAKFASWQLVRNNKKNNLTDDWEDVAQEIRIAVIRAGSYYKRQCYIEDCFSLVKNIRDPFLKQMVVELEDLWKNKTRHGANKQKFGEPQEDMLEMIVRKCVPVKKRPSKTAKLRMDAKFTIYCKSICWNQQRCLGKKISRELGLRTGMVSLSEFDLVNF